MEDDSEEEWFLDSIKRFKQLIMFDTGEPIQQIELIDEETVCLLNERHSGQKIVSILALPSKVTQTYCGSNEIQQSNDLKIKTGFFPLSPPSRILAVYGESKLLTTNHDVSGFIMYNIKSSEALLSSDQIACGTTLNFPIKNPEIALVDKSSLILTKDTEQKSFIGDLNTGEILREFTFEENHTSLVIPACLDENVIVFTQKYNGVAQLYDCKARKIIGEINVGDKSDAAIFPASSYSYILKSNTTRNISFLSQSGTFKVYDMRNLIKPILSYDLKLSTAEECLKMRFKPDNSNILSISGFDNNVYIFDITKSMTEIFKHDGHSRTEDCTKNTLVTDHLWYSSEFLISAALNNSINCWVPDWSDNS